MPLLGHAFVGLTIGVFSRPSGRAHSQHGGLGVGSELWLPAVVTLSYLPDIVAQLGLIARWSDGRRLGHSVIFAVAVSPAVAWVLMRAARVSFPRAFFTVLISLLVHDVLDLAQATDRALWWPLSDRPIGFDLGLVPADLWRQAAVFGVLLLACLALRHAAHRWVGQCDADSPIDGTRHAPLVWLGRSLIITVVLAAVVTHLLRDTRESKLETARSLIGHGAYQAGLEALARADSWPSTTKPGRIDYLRAEAFAGLGDRLSAEAHYLRALRADRTYFWVLADLALFYASSSEPVTERRRLMEPYLNRLRTEFVGHPALLKVLTRVERKLAIPGISAHEAQLGR